jgi:hypothetical protein
MNSFLRSSLHARISTLWLVDLVVSWRKKLHHLISVYVYLFLFHNLTSIFKLLTDRVVSLAQPVANRFC